MAEELLDIFDVAFNASSEADLAIISRSSSASSEASISPFFKSCNSNIEFLSIFLNEFGPPTIRPCKSTYRIDSASGEMASCFSLASNASKIVSRSSIPLSIFSIHNGSADPPRSLAIRRKYIPIKASFATLDASRKVCASRISCHWRVTHIPK
jgi:hypothetical protein